MSEIALVALLFLAGLLVFTAEIFVPSHGLLSVVGFAFLIGGVVRTFMVWGQAAGAVSVVGCLVFLPSFIVLAVKIWPKTRVGRRVAPPNPILTTADLSVPVVELSRIVGQTGRCLSPLRPVGICDFDGRRVSCVSQMGMIDSGAEVKAVGLSGANLVVQEVRT